MKAIIKVKNNIFGPLLLLLQALFFFGAGVFCLVSMRDSLELLCRVLMLITLCAGVVLIGAFVLIPHRRMVSTLVSGGLYLAVGLSIVFFPRVLLEAAVYLVGIWAFINFLWRLVLCIQLKANRDTGFLRAVFDCAISFICGLLIFLNPLGGGKAVYMVFGIYLLLYGVTMFGDFLRELLKWDLQGKYIKRHVKIRFPVLLTAFLPTKIFNKINESLNDNEGANIQMVNADPAYLDTRLEIFIHMSPNIAFGFGHVDICFDQTVYSYGTYDTESLRLFGTVCDGVFAEMPRERYIAHCLGVDDERIVSFSIYLPEDKLQNMAQYLENFKKTVYRWHCKQELDKNGSYNDPASTFYQTVGAKFYKFKSGKFKTYFAVKTNCVQLADTLVGSSGIDMISLNGIITPGTYYKYLDNMFERKNSFVVKKTVLASPTEKEKKAYGT